MMKSNDDKKTLKRKRFENNEIRMQTSIAFSKEEKEFLQFASQKTYCSSVASYLRKIVHEEMDLMGWRSNT